MAVHPSTLVSPQSTNSSSGPAQPIDVQAWTEQAAQSLNALSVTPPGGVRGTSVSLAIDLDEQSERKTVSGEVVANAYRHPRHKLLRRDSLERREALLKGKEGSRRRTRWENDRLLSNPWAQPPLPSDWEVHPTHPRTNVPYYLAPLWDQDMAEAQKKKKQAATRNNAHAADKEQVKVPKGLREKLKKAKAAKGLLRDLEEQVRLFVASWEDKTRTGGKKKEERKEGYKRRESELDSEDDEIVFVGRNGQMRDMPPSPIFGDSEDDEDVNNEDETGKDRLVFGSLANDHGASFGRWLVHSIASYYGLRTWSRTIGDPARREAYIGIPSTEMMGKFPSSTLPTPLWGMV